MKGHYDMTSETGLQSQNLWSSTPSGFIQLNFSEIIWELIYLIYSNHSTS